MKQFTVTQARAVLEAIPPDQWTTDNEGCALTHLFKHYYPLLNTENSVIRMTQEKELEYFYQQTLRFNESEGTYMSVIAVNDGEHPKYLQSEPKDRVIMLLSDMIAAGYE